MKTLTFLLSVISALFLFACKNTTKVLPQKPLVIAPFSIFLTDAPMPYKLAGTGEVSCADVHISTLDTTGKLKSVNGNILAYLQHDSLFNSQKEYFGKIDSAGNILTTSNQSIKWDESGVLIRDNQDTGFHLIPNDSKAKQAASMIIFSYLKFLKAEDALNRPQF